MAIINTAQKLIPALLVIVSIMLIVMLQFGFIFLVIALLPSIAAYYADSDPTRTTFRTIFACNLAATIPTLTPIFSSGLKFKHYNVESIMANPKVWMMVYSGAAAGWCIIYLFRYVARLFLTFQYGYRASSLERAQKRLLEEWGDTIRESTEDKEKE